MEYNMLQMCAQPLNIEDDYSNMFFLKSKVYYYAYVEIDLNSKSSTQTNL
jgi:hypothetical protein